MQGLKTLKCVHFLGLIRNKYFSDLHISKDKCNHELQQYLYVATERSGTGPPFIWDSESCW